MDIAASLPVAIMTLLKDRTGTLLPYVMVVSTSGHVVIITLLEERARVLLAYAITISAFVSKVPK